MLPGRLGSASVAAVLVLRLVGLTAAIGLATARVLPMLALALRLTLSIALRLPLLRMAMMHLLRVLLLLLMPVVLTIGADDAIIVFGVLIEILGRDSVARCTRIARHRQIFLQNLVCIAADTDIGTGAVKRLRALRHMWFTAVVTATLTLHVWTGSHDT